MVPAHVALADIGALNIASLDRFRVALIEHGFEPVPGTKRWRGPLAAALRPITAAEQMEIEFRDGWPLRSPDLFIAGEATEEHVNANGQICLWQPEDASGDWMTYEGFMGRIDEWARRREEGFSEEDAMLDAHLYFAVTTTRMATLDIDSLELSGDCREEWRDLGGKVVDPQDTLELTTRRGGVAETPMDVRLYYRNAGISVPPRDLRTFREALTAGQQRNFDRFVNAHQRTGSKFGSVLLWETPHGRNGLVIEIEPYGEDLTARALVLAPTDITSRQLRSGPDQPALGEHHVVLFGTGAIGSHVGLLLAELGLGTLTVVDRDRLRPGNLVRFAGCGGTANAKVFGLKAMIADKAPWTTVHTVMESPWHPDRVAELADGASLVLDATGSEPFTTLAATVAERKGIPFVTAALYRGGAIGRIRRQADGDVLLVERTDPARYPVIPPGPEPRLLEPGCNAIVNGASPAAVARVAATAADIVVDALTSRMQYPPEYTEMYRLIDAPAPFDHLGLVNAA